MISVPSIICDAIRLAMRHSVLSSLLAALALFLMASNPVEVLWPTQAKPMLDEFYADTVVGVLTATYFYSTAAGAWLTPRIARWFNSSILHHCVEDGQRSTMLLLRSLVQQLGAALGLVMAGSIVGQSATATAWMVGALCLVLAAILISTSSVRLGQAGN